MGEKRNRLDDYIESLKQRKPVEEMTDAEVDEEMNRYNRNGTQVTSTKEVDEELDRYRRRMERK